MPTPASLKRDAYDALMSDRPKRAAELYRQAADAFAAVDPSTALGNKERVDCLNSANFCDGLAEGSIHATPSERTNWTEQS